MASRIAQVRAAAYMYSPPVGTEDDIPPIVRRFFAALARYGIVIEVEQEWGPEMDLYPSRHQVIWATPNKTNEYRRRNGYVQMVVGMLAMAAFVSMNERSDKLARGDVSYAEVEEVYGEDPPNMPTILASDIVCVVLGADPGSYVELPPLLQHDVSVYHLVV